MADHETKTPLERDDEAPQAVFTQPLMMIPQPPIAYQMDDLAPHSFMGLAIVVAAVCGFLHFPTLFCSIPAVILSGVVSFRL